MLYGYFVKIIKNLIAKFELKLLYWLA